MKILGFILTLLSVGSAAEALALKKIIVKVPWNTPENPGVFITGNTQSLCNWKPDCLKLEEIAPHVYAADLAIDSGSQETDFEFKITRGTWETEASDGLGRAYKNQALRAADAGVVLQVVDWIDTAKPTVDGRLRIIDNFYSPQLNNYRKLRIWTPPSYGKKKNKKYPVIYMHDGQNLFDPATSSSGVSDWNMDHTLTQMIQSGEIPEAIVVGMDSTTQRFDEYDWLRLGKHYSDFVIDTVKPLIDSQYRTLTNRENTFVMGSSMGAIISYSMLWFRPEVFSKAGAPSLPTFANDSTMFRTVENTSAPTMPFRIMMSHGTFNGDVGYRPGCEAFYKMMLEKFGLGFAQLRYDVFPFADHFEADWARQMPEFLKFLLNDPVAAVADSSHH